MHLDGTIVWNIEEMNKITQNWAADMIWGRALGSVLGRGGRRGDSGRTADKLMSQRDNLGHNLMCSVGDALRPQGGEEIWYCGD
jgi:hypothetical protein